MDVKHLIPSSPTKPRLSGRPFQNLAIRNSLSVTTTLLIGATLQTILALLPIPKVYSLTPAAFLLTLKTIDTLLITFNLKPNPYLKDVIPRKSTAQVMDRDGNFSGPGKEKVAVLLLGAKSNHPLGVFAPDFDKVGGFLTEMTKQLESDPTQDSGFLGQSGFTREDQNGAMEQLFISYWRSIEDVHRYAHSPLHREAWKWWESTLKQHNYIGFMHEVFEAPKGMWEGVYINFQPTLLGSTTYLKKDGKLVGGEVKEEWVSPILDANRGPLRTSNMRRGLKDKKEIVDAMFSKNAYETLV